MEILKKKNKSTLREFNKQANPPLYKQTNEAQRD